jgi:RecA-family ATPase
MSDDFEALVEQQKSEDLARKERLAIIHITSGIELMGKKFPEQRYLWNSLLPDAGLAVMAASKAAGKTLLLLQLAAAITKGRDFLGFPTKLTKTLFIELELSDHRTQQRLLKMGIVPDGMLHFAFKWITGNEGLAMIADTIKEYGYGLVIVDVMQMLWPMTADSNSYQETYEVLSPLRQMANDLGVMIILVTHRRKMQADDYLDGVIGSVGIAANADVVFSLIRTRGEKEAVLHIDGNDIESKKIALCFNSDPLGFNIGKVSPEEMGLTPERREILKAIRQQGGKARTHEIAMAIGKKDDNTTHQLDNLESRGLLVKSGYGEWSVKGPIQSIQSEGRLNRLNTLNGSFMKNIPTGKELFSQNESLVEARIAE